MVQRPDEVGKIRVIGSVVDAKGRPISRLTIEALGSRKRKGWYRSLGRAETDQEGRFQITFSTSDFGQAEKERPDLVIRILSE